VIARSTGDAAWRHIRPPNMPLSAEEAEKVWAAWLAAGALPLPGLPGAVAA
jgi:4-hydroxy-tetrahydrodipicolinate synthase